jgi:hypothetical protein
MNRRAALDLAGDLVNVVNVHLLRIEAISGAILHGCEERMEPEKVGTLAELTGCEAYKAWGELDKRFDRLMTEGN